MVKGNEENWKEICKFEPTTATGELRQDLIRNGPTAALSEDHLKDITISSGVDFNATKAFDANVYMFTMLSNAHLLQPEFAAKMKDALKDFGKVQIGPLFF